MFYKFATIFGLVIIAIQLPAILEGSQTLSSPQCQTLTNRVEQNAFLRQEVPNSYPPETIEDLMEDNVSCHRQVVSLQDALKAAEVGNLRGGIPDGTISLVDKITWKVAILQVLRMWKNEWGQDSTPLSRRFVAQHGELVQRLQALGGALSIVHTKLVHEEMSLLHIQTVMQISLQELQSLIVETTKVLGGKYDEPATWVDFQLSSTQEDEY